MQYHVPAALTWTYLQLVYLSQAAFSFCRSQGQGTTCMQDDPKYLLAGNSYIQTVAATALQGTPGLASMQLPMQAMTLSSAT